MSAPDEFDAIARLFRPLTRGAPEAFGLMDDAAAIPARPGQDLVITKDAIVEGVHFLAGEPADLVARKLLRANLSDLAAKAAEPYGYFLAVSWPPAWDADARARFAEGLRQDGETFGLVLLGGDTTSTPGPMTASVTLLGWTPAGAMVPRSGAQPGDLVLVSGPIGDGYLDWAGASGLIPSRWAQQPRRMPEPRTDLRDALRAHASAAADISDGLVADAGHIAAASGVGVTLALEAMPLSSAAEDWLAEQPDRAVGLLQLATGGDDYQVVCTAAPMAAAGLALPVVGQVSEGKGISVTYHGRSLDPGQGGWRHP